MRIAAWNVNSLTVRLSHVLEWMKSAEPDVLALQEIKLLTEVFPHEPFTEAGYHAIASGQKTYNGVATISREAPADPVTDIPDFEDPARRVLAATIDGVRVVNLYVPNGQRVGSLKYEYKLGWFAALSSYLSVEMSMHEYVVVLGDFNVAPADIDVYDPAAWGEDILCSPAERAALGELLKLGLVDVFRQFEQPGKSFSWWDYRAGKFRRNAGLRIDLILASPALAARCTASYIDKTPRGWERPSDHTPVIAEFAL
jgi:exodeoxyribonuclease-3